MTILVGFAPDRDDQSGLELAATLARSSSLDLLVVTVVPAPWPTPVAGHTDREFEAWAQERADRGVEQARSLLADHCPEIPSEVIAVKGRSVPATLLDVAEQHEASMIVLGSGHDGSYGHVNISSTAGRLLHSAHIPVAVGTRGYRASEHGRVSRVTCAFRGDEVSHTTLMRTAEICQQIGAGLRIATFAVRGRTMYPPEVGTRAEDMVAERWVEQAGQLQEAAVERMREREILPDPCAAVVASGRTWAHAIDRLDWDRDEVLVIGSSISASLVARLFLGSSAAKIVRHSPVPVIVVP